MSAIKKAAKTTLTPTPEVTEGPYYKPGSPERQKTIAAGTPGRKLVVEGRVLDKQGRPVPHAWLDFWQADGEGQYDNEGFNLRGHQYADAAGHYHLETVRPKQYLFRAAHIHVKVRASDKSPALTAQLFFPGEEQNDTDPIFEKRTVMDVIDVTDGQKATFDFVVETV
jgi:protocatechuate 3,4-dioxygenase beta subunit